MLGSSGSGGNHNSSSMMYRQRLKEKEDEVALLQERVNSLSSQLQAALSSNSHGSPFTSKKKRRHIPLSPHAMNVREVPNGNANNPFKAGSSSSSTAIQASRERLGRNASIATRQVLDRLEQKSAQSALHETLPAPIQRILDMFQRPEAHMEYLNSDVFAKDLYKVTVKVRQLLEREPRVVFLQSPAYVFGDIHGNLEDLHFFSDNLWRLGLSLTAGNFLFLGDYVDRGLQCLECIAYLFALKLQNPQKIYLLRGNHETRDVNGWEEHYGERSFIYQCRARFGDDIGYRLWEICNQAFDRLPLAAVIDQDIFCVHGGIPRPIAQATTRIQDILTVPKVAGINPPYEHEDDKYQQVASDCIWSDPASDEQELTTVDPISGYGESLRGGGAICFGHKAVTQFLQQLDYSYIMRAHEAHAEGVAVAKGARVFTVFSTSKDHNQGSHAMAGCILVDNEKLQVINRSPAYKNQYVHRRDSVSLQHVSEPEIQKRIQLGLVTQDAEDGGDGGEDVYVEDEETWQDFEDSSEDDDEEAAKNGAGTGGVDGKPKGTSGVSPDKMDVGNGDYQIDKTRRSSVDLNSMTNVHDLEAAVAEATAFDEQQQQQQAASLWPAANTAGSGLLASYEQGPNLKRTKGTSGTFAPIDEEEGSDDAAGNAAAGSKIQPDDDEEIETVDGSDDAAMVEP